MVDHVKMFNAAVANGDSTDYADLNAYRDYSQTPCTITVDGIGNGTIVSLLYSPDDGATKVPLMGPNGTPYSTTVKVAFTVAGSRGGRIYARIASWTAGDAVTVWRPKSPFG